MFYNFFYLQTTITVWLQDWYWRVATCSFCPGHFCNRWLQWVPWKYWQTSSSSSGTGKLQASLLFGFLTWSIRFANSCKGLQVQVAAWPCTHSYSKCRPLVMPKVPFGQMIRSSTRLSEIKLVLFLLLINQCHWCYCVKSNFHLKNFWKYMNWTLNTCWKKSHFKTKIVLHSAKGKSETWK